MHTCPRYASDISNQRGDKGREAVELLAGSSESGERRDVRRGRIEKRNEMFDCMMVQMPKRKRNEMAISKITVKLDPEQMEHIRKEFLDVLEAQRAKLDKAREALNNMICEAQLQDAFGDDEGMAILDNARRALAELKD